MLAISLALFGWFRSLVGRVLPSERPALPSVSVAELGAANWVESWNDGSKFPGGFGPTKILTTDYWTLRKRSAQLFKTNLYARGIIRRLITNEVNVGLHLESTPEEQILGYQEDELSAWSENVENRFTIWARNPRLCDHRERQTFGQLQATVRREALISGDVLVVLRQDRRTRLPRIQVIDGAAVQSPRERPRLPRGHRIEHGVELDPEGRHVAFWVTQRSTDSLELRSQRLPAWGSSGRRIAWLVYGTDNRVDDVRGEPLLSLVLQSLREIDRYRDSVQRKAVVNSMLAMFIRKSEEKPGTMPITGGAVRRTTEVTRDTADGAPRRFNVAEQLPGAIIDELQHGEEPVAFPSHGTDERFGDFEEAIIQSVAWGNEIPPEILRLSFTNNYSASQAAINEYKTYLNRIRTEFGATFCEPVYQDWLLSESLSGRVSAPGLLEAWRDPLRYDALGAWMSSEWAGQIKPAVDLSKLVRGYREMVEEGFITRDRAARELTGTKYSKNVQRLRIENEQLAEARASIEEDSAAAEPAPVEELDEDTEEREAA